MRGLSVAWYNNDMAKKIENKFLQILVFWAISAVIAMIIWPLMDLFWAGVISHTEFHYTVKDYIIEPLAFAALLTLVFFCFKAFAKEKK